MQNLNSLGLAASLLLVTAASPPTMMGGLSLRAARGGAFDGLIDTSPLARSEVALRSDSRTRSIQIVERGWNITLNEHALASAYLNTACAILTRNGIPKSVVITLLSPGSHLPIVQETCENIR